jgi:hypothetical protein
MKIEMKDSRWLSWISAVKITDAQIEEWIVEGLEQIKKDSQNNPVFPLIFGKLSGDTYIEIQVDSPTSAITIRRMKMVSSFTGVIKLEDL